VDLAKKQKLVTSPRNQNDALSNIMFNFNKKFDKNKKFYRPIFEEEVELKRYEANLTVVDEEQESSSLEEVTTTDKKNKFNFVAFMDSL